MSIREISFPCDAEVKEAVERLKASQAAKRVI